MNLAAIYAKRSAIIKARKAKRLAKRKELAADRPQAGEWHRLAGILDDVFSLYIRLRDKRLHRVCRICRVKPIEVCYHFIPRGRYATRWDPENACGACSPCNGGEKWHRLEYREKHVAILGALKYSELEEKSKATAKFSAEDLRGMIRLFKDRMARPL